MDREELREEEKSQDRADILYLSDEDLEQISNQIIRQYYDVYEVLASWFT